MQEDDQKISPIKQRILYFADTLGISKREFYKTIGVSRGTLESKTGITEDILAKYIATYPEVSIEWLLTGTGDMIRKPTEQLADLEVSRKFNLYTDKNVELQRIPLYEIDATAGVVALFSDSFAQTTEDYLSIPDLPPCDGAVHVKGDSMLPILKSGDIILYKRVNNIEFGIIWGEMYLVAFHIDDEEYLMIKYVQKSDHPNTVLLVSENPKHAPKEIPLHCIRALAIIKASVRYNTMG